MLYSTVNFNVLYVDPSIAIGGDGSTPALALKNLPATADAFETDTCYIIRRTDETASVTIPNGTNTEIYNLLLMGMPTPDDLMYDIVPEEAKAPGERTKPNMPMRKVPSPTVPFSSRTSGISCCIASICFATGSMRTITSSIFRTAMNIRCASLSSIANSAAGGSMSMTRLTAAALSRPAA